MSSMCSGGWTASVRPEPRPPPCGIISDSLRAPCHRTQNGDGELDADDLQEALAKAYNAQVKQDVQALIERHKRKPGSDRCCITEDEWLEFNRPFVLGHKDQSSGRHGPTLLSTALLNVKEEALLEANPSSNNRDHREPLRGAA